MFGSIDYEPGYDYKKMRINEKQLKQWIKAVGWEALVNRRGTTWRKLPESTREGINESKAIKLMLDNLSLIKRPVLVIDSGIHVGFSETEYEKLF